MPCGGGGMSGVEAKAIVASPDDSAVLLKKTPASVDAASGSSAQHNAAITTGVLWQGALRWISQVLAWTATIAIARRLAPADIGIAGTGTVLLGLLTLVTDSGLARAIVMRRERDPHVVEHVHSAALASGTILAVLMLALAYPVASFYDEPRIAPVIAVLSVVLVLSGANAVPLAVVQQRLQYRQLAAIEFGKSISQAGTVLLCALLGFRYWSFVVGLIAGHAVALLATRFCVRISIRRPRRELIMPTASYAGYMVVGALSWYLYSNSDFVMVGRAAGLTALGFYQFGWNIAQLPGEKLANILQAVVMPFFGTIGADHRALRHYFLILSALLVSVMLPILAGFAVVSPIAVPLIFGVKWTASVTIMQILVVCAAASSVSLLSHNVMTAVGQANAAARQNLVALCVLPVSFWLAARSHGAIGAALVWLVAQPFLVGYPLLRLRRAIDLSLREYARNLVAPVTATAIMLAAVFLLRAPVQTLQPTLQLVVLSLTGAAVYTASYLLLFRSRADAILSVWRNR